MATTALSKGANASVNGNRCTVVVGSGGVDVFVFQLGADDRVRSDADVVFFNQPLSPEGAVELTAPGAVTVLLDLVPTSVATVAIAVAAGDDEVRSPVLSGLHVTLTTEVDRFRCAAVGVSTERAVILAEFYRRNGTWKVRNVSAGWEQGLSALFAHFGVTVDEGAGASVETPAHPGSTPAPVAPPTDVQPKRALVAQPPGAVPVPPGAVPAPSGASPVRPGAVPVRPGASPVPPGARPGAAKLGAGKKRIAWAAALLVAVLVGAAMLGHTSGNRTTAQSVLAAAPVATAPASPSAGTRASSSVPSVLSAVRSPPVPTAPVELVLPAPQAVSAIRTAAAAQEAVSALQRLRIAGRAPKTGYSRARFGDAWTDDVAVDGGHNGCDTRNDILRRDLSDIAVRAGSHGCAVAAGTLDDAYTGRLLSFSSGDTTIQIDHVVSLSNAWQTGAAGMSAQQRQELANDPLNLQATSSAVNQGKGDGDAATWLPPDKAYRCTYVARQVAVKQRYGLWVTAAERQAIWTVLTSCGAIPPTIAPTTPHRTPAPPTATASPVVPATPSVVPPTTTAALPTNAAPTIAAPTTAGETTSPIADETTPPTTTDETTPPTTTDETTPPTTDEQVSVFYKNCAAARAAKVTPLHRGDPGYRPGLDRDGDGIACE